MRRSSHFTSRFVRTLRLQHLEDRLAPAVVLWQGGAAVTPNNWSNDLNWVGGAKPQAADVAKFDTNNVAVVVDVPQTVAGIQLTTSWGSGFTIATSLTTTGVSTWSNSGIGGAGVWNNSGTVTLDSNPVSLGAVTLNNTGTIIHITGNNLNCGDGAIINNNVGGVYDFQGDGDINHTFGGIHTVNNKGTIRKTGGANDSYVYGIVNNQGGIWDAQSGILRQSSNGGVHTGGTFKASLGGTVDVTGNYAATWTGTYDSSGAGAVVKPNGTIIIGAAGATFNFAASTPLQLNGNNIVGTTSTLTNIGTLQLNGGPVQFGAGLTLLNQGKILHTTGNNFDCGDGFLFINDTAGVYEFQADGDLNHTFGGIHTVNNKGLFRKTGGADVSYVYGIVNNDAAGKWQADSGTLSMASNNGTHTGGTFVAAPGTAVNLTGGYAATWVGMYTGSGGGNIVKPNGTIVVGAGNATFDFPANTPVQLNGANMVGVTGGSTLNNAGVIQLNGGTVQFGANLTLANSGTIDHMTGNNFDAGDAFIFNNEVAGVYNFLSDGDLVYAFGNIHSVNNKGTFRKTGGTGQSYVNGLVNNAATGKWEAQIGNLAMASIGGTHAGGTFTASKDASIDIVGNQTATWEGAYTGSGLGQVYQTNGSMVIGPAGATFNFPADYYFWNGGSITGGKLTNATTGHINLTGGSDVVFGAVTVSNAGAIHHKTGANLLIGNSADFTNETTGTYEFASDGDIAWTFGTQPIFTNKGLVKKTAGADISYIDTAISTVGATWDAQMGEVRLRAFANTHTGGTFNAAAGAAVNLMGGSAATWKGTFTGSGAGTVYLVDSPIADATGATWNFPVSTPLHWRGGQLNGGPWTNAGFVVIDGSTVAVGGTELVNNGTINHTTNANFNLDGAATVTIDTTGVYEFQSDGDIYWASGNRPTVTNKGLIKKTGGTDDSYVDGAVSAGNGVWDAQVAQLRLRAQGQTHTGGSFKASAGAFVNLTGGTAATWKGAFAGSGAGTIYVGDTTTADMVAGAIWNFSAATPLHWRAGQLNGGAWTNSGIILIDANVVGLGTTMINTGMINHATNNNLNLDPGGIFVNETTGVYDFQSDGDIYWAAGPQPIVTNKGLIKKTGGTDDSYVDTAVSLPGAVWDAQSGQLRLRAYGQTHTGGTFKASAGAFVNLTGGTGATWKGPFSGTGAGTIYLPDSTTADTSGATWNFPAATPLHWRGGQLNGGIWTNSGTIIIDQNTVGLGTTMINTGTINHTTAPNLNLDPGGIFVNDTTGVYDFQSDADIYWVAGSVPSVTNKGIIKKTVGTDDTYIDGAVSTPTGIWEAQTGTLRLRAQGQTHTGGTFKASAGAFVNLTGGVAATWKGTFTGSGAGTIVIPDTTTADVTGATWDFPAATPLHWRGGQWNGGTWTNAGIIVIDGTTVAVAGGTELVNQGTITHTTGANMNFDGATTVTITATGVYDFQNDGDMFWASGNQPTVNNAGILRKTAGGGVTSIGAVFNNTGTVDVQTGTLDLPDPLTISGVLNGYGTLLAPVINSSGSVYPGSSPGVLTVSGNYSQSGAGDLRVELAGTNVGTQYDQLSVAGTVSLGGTLHIALGYVPAVNDVFTIIANDGTLDAVTGQFDGLAQLGSVTVNGVTFQINYQGGDGNDVTLKVTGTAATTPPTVVMQVNDGSVQRSMVTSIKATFNQSVVFTGNPFTLVRVGPGAPMSNVDLLVDLTQSTANQTIAILTFSGPLTNFKSLSDGNYTLTVSAAAVNGLGGSLDGDGNGTGGDNSVTPLHRLFGDSNGDKIVNGVDFLAFRLAFLQPSATFDLDGGGVSGSDFLAFRLNFLKMLP